jgi:two-component system sensor histidine kinase DesK
MHDVLGHSMSIIVLKSQLLARLLGQAENERTRAEIADIESTAREALQQLRQCVDGYRAAGLPHELQAAERTLAAAGMRLTVEGEIPSPPAALENLLALSLREAITNVLRHSKATRCRIQLSTDADAYRCEVSDDGVGIGSARKGNGLLGLRERLEAAGGRLHLATLAPGTLVRFDVPSIAS